MVRWCSSCTDINYGAGIRDDFPTLLKRIFRRLHDGVRNSMSLPRVIFSLYWDRWILLASMPKLGSSVQSYSSSKVLGVTNFLTLQD